MGEGKKELSSTALGVLKAVRRRYLASRDFNGLLMSHSTHSPEELEAASHLVEAGLVQVVGPSDYLNIHIRPWPSRRTSDDQARELLSLSDDCYGVALYPLAAAMKGVKLPKRFEDAPFARAMARGRSTLELAFFGADVLESYRNDARFDFRMGDFGINFWLADDSHSDSADHELDSVSLPHLGFAYDMRQFESADDDSPIVRRVAAFYGDLKGLPPTHQQRWASYQVEDDGVDVHPIWFASQMGTFPDGVGPFQRLAQELDSINVLFSGIWGTTLFRTPIPQADFGWILRADQREWDHFLHSFDKLLSENIRTSALDKAGVSKRNAAGHPLGTLARLELLMIDHGVRPDLARWAVKPLKQVRQARQKPAHELRANVTDRTFVRTQMRLMHDVVEVLINIRQWLARHPRNADWRDPFAGLKDYPM